MTTETLKTPFIRDRVFRDNFTWITVLSEDRRLTYDIARVGHGKLFILDMEMI